MEPRNEFSCIGVNMDDMASLEEVSELYFREREDSALMRMTHLGKIVVKRVVKMNVGARFSYAESDSKFA